MHLLPVKKRINRYFLSIPVTDYREAKALGSRTNWEILEALRDAGATGLTAKEMMETLNLSKNTVYGAIKFLEGPSEDSSWVESRRPRKHRGKPHQRERIGPSGKRKLVGSATRIYVEEIPFGRSYVDEEFANAILPVIEKGILKIKQKWIEIIEATIEECKKDEKRKFFPDHDEPCETCGVKHEAFEFVEAISYCLHRELVDSIMNELFPKHGFGHPKET